MSELLARAGFVELHRCHAQPLVDLVGFLIGQPPSLSEEEELMAMAVAGFRAQPMPTRVWLQGVGVTMQAAAGQTDPVTASGLRDQLLAQLYAEASGQQTGPLSVVLRHVEVLQFDWVAQLALTRRDAEGILALAERVAADADAPIDRGPERDRAFVDQLGTDFLFGATADKQFLSSGELFGRLLRDDWERIDAEWRRQVLARAEQLTAANVERVYRTPEPAAEPAPMDAATFESEMARLRADGECYRILSDVMLDSHVTSLNIIENIGGGDGYWTRTNDYGY